MNTLSIASLVSLYILLGIMALYCLVVLGWQVMVMKGRVMKNADGSFDSWNQQKTHYGIAVADIFLACPLNIAGIILIFIAPRWGYYLLALVSFWWVWANIMTTATSLRFENPKMTLNWFITFPFGIIIGLAYIVWSIVNFNIIYF